MRHRRSIRTPSDARTTAIARSGGPASSTGKRTKWAGARFWVVLVLLIVACVLLAMTTWREIGRLFGL